MRQWLAAALVVIAIGCDDPTAPDESTFTVAIRAGDDQQGPASSILGEPLEVSVTDAAGSPVQGVVVIFKLTSSPSGATGAAAGNVADSIGVTGLTGNARTFLRLGSVTGSYVVTATLKRARDRSATFEASATPAATLETVTPVNVAPLDTVVLRGQRFNTSIAGNVVFFDDVRARIASLSGDSVIRAIVPACLGSGVHDVRVAVGSASTNEVSVTYTSGTATLQLSVGEAVTVSGTELESCLRLQGGGPRYAVIPQFAADVPNESAVSFAIARVTPAGGALMALDPFAPPVPAVQRARTSPQTSQERMDAAMRKLEAEIAPSVAAEARMRREVALAGEVALAVDPTPPPLNSTRPFQVLSNLVSPSFTAVTGALRYAGANVLIYVDQRSATSLSDVDLRRVGDLFDQRLYAIDVEAFGSESDLDNNGRVMVLMTPVVNALVPGTECAATGSIAGFFYPNDLYLNNQGSNKGEVFYTLVPDPGGVHSCQHSLRQVLDLIPPTFIHEMQHMISFNQHVIARGGSSEIVWLNEGLSLVAEELGGRYFEQRYPPPFNRTLPTSFFPDSALLFEGSLLVNAYRYLSTSQTVSVTNFRDFGSLQERGAAWLFLRWLADQKGDGIFARLVQTRHTSVRNVEEQSGESFDALFGDFAIAVAADIPSFTLPNLAARHQFPSRDFTRIFSEIASRNGLPQPNPVTFTQLTTISPIASGSMPRSTMSFYQVPTSTATPTVAVRFAQPNSAPFPANLSAQVGLVRVQ